MIEITDEILESINEYKNNLKLFEEGKIENFKSFSSVMGVYKEKLTETYMMRPKIPNGIITLDQFKEINDISRRYSQGKMRFTTRQDIQLHSIEFKNINNVLDELIKVGISTKDAGGDSINNIVCSPLSGVASNEVFDVTSYAAAITNYMMKDTKSARLPRKCKISFSNSLDDTVNATITDMGFIAKKVNGKKGFEVYIAGGLGTGAKVGIKLEEFIDHKDALYYVQAMKQLFNREGDRKNRFKARLRFVLQRLGEEEFRRMFNMELEKLKSEKDLILNIDDTEKESSKLKNSKQWDKKYGNRIVSQKQKDYYSVEIHPQNGNMDADNLDSILEFLTNLDYKISIRLTTMQGFYVRDLKQEDAEKLADITSNFSSIFELYNSIVCAGPRICKFGISNSQGLVDNIIKTFNSETFEIKNSLPQILISGCPSSCGQPQIGAIGLSGRKKRTDSGMVPIYSVLFNGKVGPGVARLGVVYGEIAAKKISNFLVDLAKLKLNSEYIEFVEFFENKENEIIELIEKYSSLESFSENPDLYSDFE
ncbi:nitrite/sulfite reductase [Clostridium sp. SHJSY1]|uniref:nitrite/sulfite reductase n=1 Tax=Clostridium sp. SHJSY1 TaxID=2942483 RepID=UPI0028748065|nr:nitrite/sulfite reductase [Clostridium sp. SHJSY1]MDS0524836.1 nitrite/sulfite reductase [Clostridium sp. SHJSY1]